MNGTRRHFIALSVSTVGLSVGVAGCLGDDEDVEEAVNAYDTVLTYLEDGIDEFETGVDYFEENEHSNATTSFGIAEADFDRAEDAWSDFSEAAVEVGVNESEYRRFLETYSAILRYSSATFTFKNRAEQTDDGEEPILNDGLPQEQHRSAQSVRYADLEEVESTLSG